MTLNHLTLYKRIGGPPIPKLKAGLQLFTALLPAKLTEKNLDDCFLETYEDVKFNPCIKLNEIANHNI